MPKVYLYKDDDGTILQATEFTPVNKQEIIDRIAYHRKRLSELQTTLTQYNSLENAANGTDTTPPATLQGVDNGEGHVMFTKLPAPELTPITRPETPLVPIQPIQI